MSSRFHRGEKPAIAQAAEISSPRDLTTFLIAAICLSALSAAYAWHYALIGWDDAWIYFRAARNVVNGFGPVMNPGDSHAVGTSLLWTYLLAAGHSILGSCDVPAVARILTAAFMFGSGVLLSLVLRTKVGELGLLAPGALVSLGLLRGCAGLETHLAVFAGSVALFCHFVRRSLAWTGAALGVAFFCRGDAILLGAPIALHVLVEIRRDRRAASLSAIRRDRLAVSLSAATRGVVVGGFVLGVGLILHRLLTGEFLPSTLATKMIQGHVGPWQTYGERAVSYLLWALQGHWWLAVPAVVGALLLGWTSVVLLGAAALHWAAYAWLEIAAYPWYSWLLQLAISLCMVVGIGWMVRTALRRLPFRWQPRTTDWTALGLSAALVATRLVSYGEIRPFAGNPSLIDSGAVRAYVQVAGVLIERASGTTSSGSPAIALCEEVGILSYECASVVIRDINGVASPGLTRKNLNDWQFWVEKYSPEFLVARSDTAATRVYADFPGHRLWAYRRVLLEQDPEFVAVSVYQRSDDEVLGSLHDVLSWDVEAPGARFLTLPSGQVVFLTPAPSRIRLTPPSGATHLSIGMGHCALPTEARDRADGVVFRIVGVRANGHEQELVRHEQQPVFGGDGPAPMETEVALEPGSYRELLLLVEPSGNTDWDWAYWSKVAFDRQ